MFVYSSVCCQVEIGGIPCYLAWSSKAACEGYVLCLPYLALAELPCSSIYMARNRASSISHENRQIYLSDCMEGNNLWLSVLRNELVLHCSRMLL